MARFTIFLLLCTALLAAAPARADSAPRLRVVVVLDSSGSMTKNDPDLLARLAARLLVDLSDQRDEVTLIRFGTDARVVARGKGGSPALASALDQVTPDEKCTDYALGLERAGGAFAGAPAKGERRLVVFLTDGKLEPAKDGGKLCADFEKAAAADRSAIESAVLKPADRLAQSKAKVFVVGLGKAFDSAQRSRALLEEVARRTGGRFLRATTAEQVPEFFTDVFAALVGAPVFKPAPAANVSFDVPPDAAQLHVVILNDDAAPRFDVTGPGGAFPFGKPASEARGPVVRLERGNRKRGYALYWLEKPSPGTLRVSGGQGSLRVWAIADVGTSLAVHGLPDVLPETKAPTGRVSLATRNGKPVHRESEFMRQVTFEVQVDDGPARAIRAVGDETSFELGRLAPRDAPYTLTVRASHAEGFLQVDEVKKSLRVIHQIPLSLSVSPIAFDTMAEPGTIATATARVTAPDALPAEITVQLALADDVARHDLRFEPAELRFGPGKPEPAEIRVSFADPESLRSTDRRYDTRLTLTVSDAQSALISGDKRFSAPVQGTLRAWTLSRWLKEYRTELIIALLALLALIWAVGRAVARKFPPKARIHYQELGEPFASDSAIKRHARRGAYRSARFGFPLSKKAKPLVTVISTGSAFEIRPERGTTVYCTTPTGEEERRAPFRGRFDERYRLGDRYEIWLTRI